MSAYRCSLPEFFALISVLIFGQLLAPMCAVAAEIEVVPSQAGAFNFTLPDLKDDLDSLNNYRGKVVLVNFWASWCPPCIHEMPVLQKLKQQLADRPFEILAINVGEKKYKVRKFTRLIRLELPVLLDTDQHIYNQWGIKTLPTSFLVDATGTVRYRVRGNPGWDNAETLGTIDRLLQEPLNTTTE